MKRAFTLIELLVVIAIVCILAGVIYPALSSAKSSGKHTGHLISLKQLGMAWSIYSESHDDSVAKISKLWESKLIDRQLLISNCDPWPEGWANPFPEFALPHDHGFYYGEKVSVLDYSEILGNSVTNQKLAAQSERIPGWAIIPGCDAKRFHTLKIPPTSDASLFVGSYSRLNRDGSAVRVSVPIESLKISGLAYFGGKGY